MECSNITPIEPPKTQLNVLRKVLFDNNTTNTKLAEVLGTSYSRVSSWKHNKTQPSLEMLFKIAKYFNLEVSDLIVKDNPF